MDQLLIIEEAVRETSFFLPSFLHTPATFFNYTNTTLTPHGYTYRQKSQVVQTIFPDSFFFFRHPEAPTDYFNG